MRLARWSVYVAYNVVERLPAFYSDWDITARLFFPARRKSSTSSSGSIIG